MKKKQWLKYLMASLSGLLVLFTLAACQSESIDGNWTSPSSAQAMYEEALTADMENLFAYSDHTIEEIVTGGEVNFTVKDDKAVFELALLVDEEMFFTALKDEQDAAVKEQLSLVGVNYDDLSEDEKKELAAELASDDELRELVQLAIDEMAEGMGGSYQADKGVVSTTLFKADVNRATKTLEVTEVNEVDGNTIVTNGEAYQYSYKDGKLVLEGETDEDDMTFEKKK